MNNGHGSPEHPQVQSELERGFDPRSLLLGLLKYKWLVLGTAALVGVAVTFWTLRQQKIYQATCVLEFDPSPPRPLGSEVEDVADPIGNFWASREFFETQNRIISSRSVAEKVVRKLGLQRDADFLGVEPDERRGWKGATVERAAGVLQERLSVEMLKNTRLVYVHVQDTDPGRAAVLANAVADAYTEKTVEDRLGSTLTAVEWLSTQLDDVKHRLDRSELSLHQFKQENNILSLSMEDRQNIVANDIQHFNTALTEAQTRRIALTARLEELRLANQEDPLEVHAPMIQQNLMLEEFRRKYREKGAERDALSERYGANHPEIQARQRELDTMREQIRDEIDGLISSAASELREAQATENGLRAALETSNRAGLELNLREIEYQRLNRERENNSKMYGILLERTTETNLTKLLRTTHVRLVDRALKPGSPVSPQLRVNIAAGALGGLLLGLGLALLMNRMDRTIRSVEDAEALGLTVLGILPSIESEAKARGKNSYSRKRWAPPTGDENKDLVVHTHPMSSVAECCRTIRTNIMFMSADDPVRTLVITSAGLREGKTTVATSLAVAIAQSGKRVLLIDTDLRRPRVHRAFQMKAGAGITSVLIGACELTDAIQETHVPGVCILPCGPIPPNPAELLHTARFRETIAEAKGLFDLVLLDSPPLGAVTDAAIIAPQVQATIVVIQAQSTSRDALRSALRQLHDVNANIAGGVLNDVDLNERTYAQGQYYYYYRRGDYYRADDDGTGGNEPSGGSSGGSSGNGNGSGSKGGSGRRKDAPPPPLVS